MAGSSGNRRVAACALACATLLGCFGGPGLEPPGGGSDGRGPGVPTTGGAGVMGDAVGAMGGGSGGMGGFAAPPENTAGGSGVGTDAGSVAPMPVDGGVDSGVDAGPDAQTNSSCADIAAEFEAALAAAQDCSGGEACTHTSLNAGCIGTSNNGLLPLCGLAHREGADFSALLELDDAYGAGACYEGPVVCAGCAQPEVSCVAGRCTQDAPNGA